MKTTAYLAGGRSPDFHHACSNNAKIRFIVGKLGEDQVSVVSRDAKAGIPGDGNTVSKTYRFAALRGENISFHDHDFHTSANNLTPMCHLTVGAKKVIAGQAAVCDLKIRKDSNPTSAHAIFVRSWM